MGGVLGAVSSDGAVLMLTVGVGLIYYEMNRPGTIVAGAAGLLVFLLGVAELVGRGMNPVGVVLILMGVLLLAADLVRPMPVVSAIFATAALVYGLWKLPAHRCCAPVHVPVAAGCGVLIGAGTCWLTRIARRARTNKGLRRP